MRVVTSAALAACVVLAAAPRAADAALICSGGHLHYGGSEFHASRSEATASAVEAWRRVRAQREGARAERMFPHGDQLQCERATTQEGWRCFVRGGPCHKG